MIKKKTLCNDIVQTNKTYNNKGQSIHYPNTIKEWHNSIYNFHRNEYIKALCIKDTQLYRLFNTYFNCRFKINNLYLSKIFISKPEVKHFNNKINITLFIYNRQVIYLLKNFLIYKRSINKLNKLIKYKLESFKYEYFYLRSKKEVISLFLNKNKMPKIIKILINKLLILKCIHKILYEIKPKILKLNKKFNNYKFILYLYKKYINKNKMYYKNIKFNLNNLYNLYNKFFIEIIYDSLNISINFNKYKFNLKNLLYIKNILFKIYNKNIELNIINLKYLYLDSNLLATVMTKKLKNRNKRILKVIRMALKLSKKLYIKEYYSYYLNIRNTDILLVKKSINTLLKNILFNKSIIQKPILYNNRIVLYYLNNKIIKGIRLQGTGRLTKRLTASRSIIKYGYKGSLKNDKSSLNGFSAVMLKGYVKSNLQYTNRSSYNLIGAYGIKS